MKNTLMLLIVIAGLATVTYRFLPVELQQQVNAQLQKISQTETLVSKAVASDEQKKYKLVIPDGSKPAQKTEALVVASAYIQHLQDVHVEGEGRLVKVLSDDNDGSKHQRFILKTPEDVTVLIAHNIDIAQRINNLTIGDTIYFSGEYVWNEKGGLVHWTHRDPRGSHESGWLRYNGAIYH